MFFRPRGSRSDQSPAAGDARFDPPRPVVFPSSVGAVPVVPPPTIPPDRLFQNDRPNTPPTVAHRPEDVPPPDRSYPGLPKALHGDVIVARFFRAANLILQSENDGGRVGNGKWFHSSMKPQFLHNAQLLMSLCLVMRRSVNRRIARVYTGRCKRLRVTNVQHPLALARPRLPRTVDCRTSHDAQTWSGWVWRGANRKLSSLRRSLAPSSSGPIQERLF